MWIVRLALRRPYTFVVVAMLIAILGVTAIISMPVDIFPYIDIPVVSVVWTYGGLSPEEMEKRMVTIFERAMTTRSEEHTSEVQSPCNRVCRLLLEKKQRTHQRGGAGTRRLGCVRIERVGARP